MVKKLLASALALGTCLVLSAPPASAAHLDRGKGYGLAAAMAIPVFLNQRG